MRVALHATNDLCQNQAVQFSPTPSQPRSTRQRCLRIVLTAVAAVALLAALWAGVLDRIEQREFDQLVSDTRAAAPQSSPGTDDDVLRLMNRVNGLLKGIHVNQTEHSDSTIPMTSSDEHLHNPIGACASYSHVLAKTLMSTGYEVRKVGLAKDSRRAIHHVIEVRRGDHWVLLDAFYDLAFRRRDGQLASAEDVSRDWDWFRRQIPSGYNADYDYSEFYYTNWGRLPVLGWLIRAWPWLEAKLNASGVSVRFWFFNTYRWIAGLAAFTSLVAWWLRSRLRCNSTPAA